jgi:Histone chaperone domain CHZ
MTSEADSTPQEVQENGLKRVAAEHQQEPEKKIAKTEAQSEESEPVGGDDSLALEASRDKGKEKVKGKGKKRYESEPEEEEEEDEDEDNEDEGEAEEENGDDEEEDSLEEIDTSNIIHGSRTRRKVIDYRKTLEEIEAENRANGAENDDEDDEEDDADFKAPVEEES